MYEYRCKAESLEVKIKVVSVIPYREKKWTRLLKVFGVCTSIFQKKSVSASLTMLKPLTVFFFQ